MSEENTKPKPEGTEAVTQQTSDQPAEKQETSSTAKAETEGERRFSQEELDEKIEKRLSKERRRIEREVKARLESEMKPKEPEAKPKQEPKQEEATRDDGKSAEALSRIEKVEQDLARERADKLFMETLADNGMSLDKKKRDILRALFDPESPDDIIDTAATLGLNKAEPQKEEAKVDDKNNDQPDGEKPGDGPAHIYRSPGAPRSSDDFRERDLTKWTKDMVDRMRADGTLMGRILEYRDSLPGGSGTLFRRKVPKVK